MQRQSKLIERGELKRVKVLEKDDFIGCLIYCVAKGIISLRKLGVSLKYFNYIFDDNINSIMSAFNCGPCLTDLEAAFDYLSQWRS